MTKYENARSASRYPHAGRAARIRFGKLRLPAVAAALGIGAVLLMAPRQEAFAYSCLLDLNFNDQADAGGDGTTTTNSDNGSSIACGFLAEAAGNDSVAVGNQAAAHKGSDVAVGGLQARSAQFVRLQWYRAFC